jgi:hypothetical protein
MVSLRAEMILQAWLVIKEKHGGFEKAPQNNILALFNNLIINNNYIVFVY